MARKYLLTDIAVKAAKPGEKIRRVMDGEGLFLTITPDGAKWWAFRFKYDGQEKMLSLGSYPGISLAEAREKHQAARKQLKEGINPAAARQAAAQAEKMAGITLREVARQWLEKREPGWSPVHIRDTRQKLDRYIFPRLGGKPIASIGRREVKEILDMLDRCGNIPTLKKVRSIVGQVFRYAVNQEIPGVNEDPTLYLRGKGIFTTSIVRHRAFLMEPKDIARLMRAIEGYADPEIRIKTQTALALKFSALVFCRPGEIAKAEWSEFDFGRRLWTIPASKMKAKRTHLVPLARQTLKLLDQLKNITGHCCYLFPNTRTDSRAMSAETINAALRGMGFSREEMTSHGFRGMASTRLNEHGWNADWVELQLAMWNKTKFAGPTMPRNIWRADAILCNGGLTIWTI